MDWFSLVLVLSVSLVPLLLFIAIVFSIVFDVEDF